MLNTFSYKLFKLPLPQSVAQGLILEHWTYEIKKMDFTCHSCLINSGLWASPMSQGTLGGHALLSLHFPVTLCPRDILEGYVVVWSHLQHKYEWRSIWLAEGSWAKVINFHFSCAAWVPLCLLFDRQLGGKQGSGPRNTGLSDAEPGICGLHSSEKSNGFWFSVVTTLMVIPRGWNYELFFFFFCTFKSYNQRKTF